MLLFEAWTVANTSSNDASVLVVLRVLSFEREFCELIDNITLQTKDTPFNQDDNHNTRNRPRTKLECVVTSQRNPTSIKMVRHTSHEPVTGIDFVITRKRALVKKEPETRRFIACYRVDDAMKLQSANRNNTSVVRMTYFSICVLMWDWLLLEERPEHLSHNWTE